MAVLPLLDSQFLGLTSVVFVLYVASLYTYRIYFSPLSHVPGPKLAAATRWYEFYYDAVKSGRFWVEIERMHEQYGPIVRISPYEVHIKDGAFFHTLYSITNKLDKDPWYYAWLDLPGSIFSTLESDLHKQRSAPIKRAFSTVGISRIEHVIHQHFETFSRRLRECAEKGVKVKMGEVWRALAIDVVSDVSLPESYNLLEKPDFGEAEGRFVRGLTRLALWNRHLLYVSRTLQKLPRWFVALQGETALLIVDGVEHRMEQARRVIRNGGKRIGTKSHPVIMNEVYNSELPPKEKELMRLYEEIAILIGAGSETTTHALSTITYHLLANPQLCKRLKDEVCAEFSSEELSAVLGYKRLEHLPYLNACVSEGLRLASSVCGRLPRVNKTRSTTYTNPKTLDSCVIPAGVAISMTTRDVHYAPEFFPEPSLFKPERWLGDNKVRSDQWLVVFGRGARSCVGKNLAMAELLMGVANFVGRFETKLAKGTSRKEVETWHDYFSPYPVIDNNGLLVEVLI